MAELSEGAVLLHAAGSIVGTAKRLRCTTRSVSAWRAGALPSRRARQRMQAVFGIHPAAWDRLAGAPQEEPQPIYARDCTLGAVLRDQHARLVAVITSGVLTERARIDYERTALATVRAIEKLERPRVKPHARTMALSLARRLQQRADAIDAERNSHASIGDASHTA